MISIFSVMVMKEHILNELKLYFMKYKMLEIKKTASGRSRQSLPCACNLPFDVNGSTISL